MFPQLNDLLSDTASMHILVVDDNLDFRNEFIAILKDFFCSIDQACNGKEALALYAAKNNPYDIVITDLGMPVLDGIGLIKKIQKINPTQAIIVISAYNETAQLLECIHLGIASYVIKPLQLNELVNSLSHVVSFLKTDKQNRISQKDLEEMLAVKTIEIKNNYETMQELLTIDKITKLPNAEMLNQRLKILKQKRKNITAMLYNIDSFSLINEAYGFEAGNSILKRVGEFLSLSILPHQASLFRYTSDEFVIVFNGKVDNPLLHAQQIQSFFHENPVYEQAQISLHVTLSCGIVTSQHLETLLPKAREALKIARRYNLANQVSIYNAKKACFNENAHQLEWIRKTRSALEENRIIPYFQPIVDNQTQAIMFHECLVRMQDKKDLSHIISPNYFLPATRKSGLMCNLTKTMISKCFKMFANSSRAFTLNISQEDICSNDFVEFLLLKQQKYAIASHQVVLEIVEDIILDDTLSMPLKNIQKLKSLGYQIALDDFGVDKSNFNRLKNIGVDYLKIDGQFIRCVHQHECNQNIVESIVRMANKLNIKVIAEFVETVKEYEMIKALGVHYTQGYYFYKPSSLPIEE